MLYRAVAFTMERRQVRRKPVGAVWHWRRMSRAFARPLSCLLRSSRLMSIRARESFV
ncbi:MAG: hypothetical protein M3N42_14805 [Cyanobacteriota bacterium]|nr:hypothetical protein [Cyanobacteriota bacterium]